MLSRVCVSTLDRGRIEQLYVSMRISALDLKGSVARG
jgi:hypothetical protein